MELKQLIIALSSLMSISGHEQSAHAKVRELVGENFDEITTDSVGNLLLVRRCGKKNAARVLIDTHLDEIGMVVTDICDGGFLRLTSIGGLDCSILQASDVVVYGKETLRGVITSTPPHLRSSGGDKKLTELESLFVDTGYEKEELEALVSLGTPVGFAPRYTELLGGNLVGKSFDDKACAAAAIDGLVSVPREKLAADVYLVLSCHEETVRIGGVAPAAFATEPDYAMVIDVNLARVPDTPKYETVEYGKGVSLSISPVTDKKLTKMTERLCRNKQISFTRIAAPSSTGTNTPALNLVGHGVPTVDVGLPLKSMHTATEVINIEDARALSALVREFVCSEEIKEAFAV